MAPSSAGAYASTSSRVAPASRSRIRWRIFWILFAVAVMVYFQQRNLTVAAERIMPELSLSQMQIGWLQWAFVVSYAAMQFPGGVLGQRFGARRTLTVLLLVAVAATVAVPLAPLVLSGVGLFVLMLSTQFLLGAVHAPVFPIIAGLIESWLPSRLWAFGYGVNVLASQLGAALAPPVLVYLMQRFGWQPALFWAALPPLGLIALWAWYGRSTPREHPGVSAEELAELDITHSPPSDSGISAKRILHILLNRDIALITVSYACMNVPYYLLANWSFLYLIQQRHFTVLEGGLLASLPPLGAAFGAGVGGGLTDTLCRRYGVRWGYRLVPLIALPVAGLLMLLAVHGTDPYLAVAGLTVGFAAVEMTEGAYWGGTMHIAQSDSMAATGLMNTGGNMGGIVSVPLVAYFSGHGAWDAAFNLGAVSALLAAATWLAVDLSRSHTGQNTTGTSVGFDN